MCIHLYLQVSRGVCVHQQQSARGDCARRAPPALTSSVARDIQYTSPTTRQTRSVHEVVSKEMQGVRMRFTEPSADMPGAGYRLSVRWRVAAL